MELNVIYSEPPEIEEDPKARFPWQRFFAKHFSS